MNAKLDKAQFGTTATRIDNLGTMAADVAMRGAVDYLRANPVGGKRQYATEEIDRLLVLIRQYAKIAVVAALDDAGKAIEAGMVAVAEQTFRATMALAGIKAAQQFAKEWVL